MNGENTPAKKKNVWVIIIVFISIWLILGGLYFWSSTREPEPPPQLVVKQPPVNEDPDIGRLNLADTTEEDAIANSRSFLGYIGQVRPRFGNLYTLDIDYIEWISGPESKQAALDDGACETLEECATQGFYIRNEVERYRTFDIAPNVEIIMQTYSLDKDNNFNINQKISIEEFKRIFTTQKDKEDSPLRKVPYLVEREDGSVIKIMEKYIHRKIEIPK